MSPKRYALFEATPTGEPVVLEVGWSWAAFLTAPLWAAQRRLWPVALGWGVLVVALAWAVLRSHPAQLPLLGMWLLLSCWTGAQGPRWVVRRIAAGRHDGTLFYFGETVAASRQEAEQQAREHIEIRRRMPRLGDPSTR